MIESEQKYFDQSPLDNIALGDSSKNEKKVQERSRSLTIELYW
jgi:hypothetical protein